MEKEQAINDLQSAIGRLESFAYSVAHDLRAPLRAIDGFSALLERDSADCLNADAGAKVSCIRDGVRRMQSLIDDLLELSRCGSAELQRNPVDLSELANAVVENLRRGEPERQVEFAVAERLPVDGDRRLLLILLENILGNAWKYTSKRGVAHIEFSFEPERSAYAVRDNGAGFDMDYAEKLFRPFQRLHSTAQFEGNGLGLCIVRRIVERHGGRVWIESAKDRGTTIYFTLQEAASAGVSGKSAVRKQTRM